MKRLNAMKKLGMEKHMILFSAVSMSYIRILEDLLHIKTDAKQQAFVSSIVGECSQDLIMKWVNQDASSTEKDKEFQDDLIEVMVKSARKMKLKSVNRETITKRLMEIREEAKEQND